MLYQTGREARIMPDGRLEFMEQGGRTEMREGLTGRKFLDLYKLEQTIESADGVTKAEAYVRYGEGNNWYSRQMYGAFLKLIQSA